MSGIEKSKLYSAKPFAAFCPENFPVGRLYRLQAGLSLIKVHKKIRLNQDLMIPLRNRVIGMMMGNQPANPVAFRVRVSSFAQQRHRLCRAFLFLVLSV